MVHTSKADTREGKTMALTIDEILARQASREELLASVEVSHNGRGARSWDSVTPVALPEELADVRFVAVGGHYRIERLNVWTNCWEGVGSVYNHYGKTLQVVARSNGACNHFPVKGDMSAAKTAVHHFAASCLY